MFDSIRNHKKYLMGFLMILIIPSFVLFGIEGYSRFNEGGEVVARVSGKDITRQEWDAAHRQESDRLLASMPTMDRSLLDSDEARYATLERLVRDRVMVVASQKMHLVASNQRLARELQQSEAIAALRKPDGSLDMEAYRQLVGSQGMTPEQFEASVRADLSRLQVAQGVAVSGFVPQALAKSVADRFFERREIQLTRFNPADFRSQVKITDEDVQRYYDSNKPLFEAPEQADVEYLVLDIDALAKGLTVSEADLRSYYQQNAERLAGGEQRRARHILLTVPAGASADDKAKIKAKAQALHDKVAANPGQFADVAKAESQDPGSAANGGDLDYFARGAMVKPFEDVAFQLEKNRISDVVETEFGFHIIQVTDIKKPDVKPFEALRAQLEGELRKQQAQKQYAEAAEQFSNLVYEQADSLAPAAERFKLTVQTAKGLSREGERGPLSNAKLLQALFSSDSIQNKRNTEAVETGTSQLTAARIVRHTPAQVRPLAEVAAGVRERLTAERSAALAKTEGEAKLAAWRQDASGAKLPAAVVVGRDKPEGLSAAILQTVLSADLKSAPAWTGIDLGAQGYAVARVNRVIERPAPAADMAQRETAELSRLWNTAEGQAYMEFLKTRYKAEIRVPRPKRAGA